MSEYIKIENCNCITSASLEIANNALNIKYGSNGTGKTTISEAIFAKAKGDSERLQYLKPYGAEGIEPTVDNASFCKIRVFDENYVGSYLFKGDEFFEDSFNVFLKSAECDALVNQIEQLLSELQKAIWGIPEIQNLRSFLPQYEQAVNASQGVVNKKGGVSDFIKGNGGGFDRYSELDTYRPYYDRDLVSVSKWAKWRNDGVKQTQGNTCPFCTADLPTKISEQNATIAKVFKNSALTVANAVTDYLRQAINNNYISEKSVVSLNSYIGDVTKSDELFAELTTLAKETDYLYKKIEKICNFKPMNVSHEQLVNLEDSLSELVIEERHLTTFYNTDLIKSLLQTVSSRVSELKTSTGILKGLFLKHENKLNKLINDKQEDINQFFTIAGFPYNFCLKKEGERKAKAYLVPVSHQNDIVSHPQSRLSWGEKNAFSLVMFMFEALSDNADLIVLDDPISAFDEKKKFAIIRRLFDNHKTSFRDKTVVMLTHDFQPIIDYVHGGFFARYGLTTPVSAMLLQNVNGTITEVPITKDDLKNTIELTKSIVTSSNEKMAVRIVNLRKYVELTIPEFGSKPIYEILSNLIHGRTVPKDKDGNELTEEVKTQGIAEINNYIPDKTYDDLIAELQTESLIDAASSLDLYYRIISIRLLFERVEGALSLLRREHPGACKFINETNHVENDYIFQLDPRSFFSIPSQYLSEIESFIQENRDLILSGIPNETDDSSKPVE